MFDIPKAFVFKYIDRDFHGNDPEHKERLINKEIYDNWTRGDQQYYQLCEMRLASTIPVNMLVGYMVKT